jgi:hypothetical protein
MSLLSLFISTLIVSSVSSQAATVAGLMDMLVNATDNGQGEMVASPLLEAPTADQLAAMTMDELNELLYDSPVIVVGQAVSSDELPNLRLETVNLSLIDT